MYNFEVESIQRRIFSVIGKLYEIQVSGSRSKVSLEHSPTHSLIHICPRPGLCYSDRAEKLQRSGGPQSLKMYFLVLYRDAPHTLPQGSAVLNVACGPAASTWPGRLLGRHTPGLCSRPTDSEYPDPRWVLLTLQLEKPWCTCVSLIDNF